MQSNEQSSIVNDNLEDETFRFHLDSKNGVGRVGPKAVDVVDDRENDSSDKWHNVQNQFDNMVCFGFFSSSIEKLMRTII